MSAWTKVTGEMALEEYEALECQREENKNATDTNLIREEDNMYEDTLQFGAQVAAPTNPTPINVMSDSGFKEMSIDDLATVLDSTIKHDYYNKVIVFLAMLTAYTEEDQLNVCLLGQSSSGKTYLAQEVAKYFPKEDVREYAEVSPTAFKHANPTIDEETGEKYIDLERIIMLFTEMPYPQLLSNLRPLLSHDKKNIEFLTTDRAGAGGNRAKQTIMRGFPTVIFCSAYTRLDEQEATRCILLSPEVSAEKVKAGVELANEKAADRSRYSEKVAADPARQELVARIEYIKGLHINSVIIKDPDEVLQRFRGINSMQQSRSQRDIAHLNSLIKAVAMLNAANRLDDSGNVIANSEDIETGIRLWQNISETQSLGIPPAVHDFLTQFIIPCYQESMGGFSDMMSEDGITHDQLAAYYYAQTNTSMNADTVKKQYLPALQAAGLITLGKGVNDRRKVIIKPVGLSEKIGAGSTLEVGTY